MEITKSFSLKVNLGDYQSSDFFCSAKAEAPEGEEAKVGEKLHKFCKNQVFNDYRGSIKQIASQITKEEKDNLLK